MKIEGILPALITPIDQNEKLNVKELERMLEYLIAEGANGFYVLGGTGEGILVPRELHKQMTRETIRLVKGRVPCIVHVARLEYDEMIELAKYAEEQGADAISAIPPIYYKYSEEEIYAYFKRLCEAVKIPVIIYNSPLANVPFSNALLDRLFEIENLAGIKWTNPNYMPVMELKGRNPETIVVNGPDELLLMGLTAGCSAGIGTTYNVLMPYFTRIYKFFKEGNYEEAYKNQQTATNIIAAMIPFNALKATKFLLSMKGFDVDYNFYPKLSYTDEEKAALLAAVRKAGMEI